MATCEYCSAHRGKRACPALGGAICSPCCGKHRLQEIDCPPGCVWLGSLSITRDPGRALAPTKDAWSRAMDKLLEYLRTAEARPIAEEARDLFCPDGRREVDDWEVSLLVAFMTYGHRDANGRRLIDQFIMSRGRDLSAEEMAAVVAQQRAWAGLFEVTAVHKAAGLDLRDLLSGETIHVKEVSATAHMQRWDVLFAWLFEIGGHVELTGAACAVPRRHLPRVEQALKQELEQARPKRRGVSDRDLVGEVAWAPIAALRDAIDDFKMPRLNNMHGETLMLCKAHFRLSPSDEDEVRDRLDSLPDMDPTDDGFNWQDRKGHPSLGEGPLNLGVIRIGAGQLTLDVNSRERLARGKKLIAATLKGIAVHEADSVQDVESAMREHRGKPKRSEDEIPETVRREVLGQFLQQHYARWIDQRIPALGGKTPRAAVKTRSGRAHVETLLKQAESDTMRMEGGDRVDFDGLRRELGLIAERDEAARDGYDAAVAPDRARWLASDDQQRSRAVEDHHRNLAGHPDTPNPQLHALMHVIVENQLAAGDPPEVVATLERLVASDLNRHEAIHAIGSVVAEEIWRIMKKDRPFDREVVARSLSRLRPGHWAGSVRRPRSAVPSALAPDGLEPRPDDGRHRREGSEGPEHHM